jgi:tetratricopeptide (TPR) repeat protein
MWVVSCFVIGVVFCVVLAMVEDLPTALGGRGPGRFVGRRRMPSPESAIVTAALPGGRKRIREISYLRGFEQMGKWARECIFSGMRRFWCFTIIIGTAAAASGPTLSPGPELLRAQELYRRTEYRRAIDMLQASETRDAVGQALLGKALVQEGRHKEAVAALEKAVAQAPLESDYYDWLGRAYGRVAETSSFVSALGWARKTVRAFERAIELDPSNLEALSDVFEYYLQAPGIAGGGMEKADRIARQIGALNPAEGHWAQANLAEKRKDFTTAEREYRAAADSAPKEVGRSLDLAAFLAAHGRYAESDALFRTAEAEHPDSPKVLYARAASCVRSKRHLGEAAALLERYLGMQTTSEDPTRREASALLESLRAMRTKSRQAE